MTRYERLDGGDATLILAIEEIGAPRLIHFGARLAPKLDPSALDGALKIGPRASTPDDAPLANIFPVSGFGWMGAPALAGARLDGDPAFAWSSVRAERAGQEIEIQLMDVRQKISTCLLWRLDAGSGVLSARTVLRNEGTDAFIVHALASLALPLPSWSSDIVSFLGDWAREAQPQRFAAPVGVWSQVNRTGRTGFSGSTLLLAARDAQDAQGNVLALHLAWSGDHSLSVETMPSGERQALVCAAIAPGEIVLMPGQAHEAPTALVCYSNAGFNGVSKRFHAHVRANILRPRAGPRRVHFNSWEGVYFDFDCARLIQLADEAAALGVERFVLDDGWFAHRRNDRAGLGDWRVDANVFPDGLDALINHVQARGMDFGLWVEPEMINRDSDLYRAHPDWCVHAPNAERPTMRHQLWLDLSRQDVRDHLFAQLDALLRAHAISYLKWDCNRFQFPAVSGGRAAGQAITRGVYDLMDRLLDAHPALEIESCASGGARIDFEILRRATRVWTSDATDAIERLRIQRWTGVLAPPEILGAHVGPSPNPITGRRLSMGFRAKIAMFGHMGVELDPASLSASDRSALAAHIALYKSHRALLHGGEWRAWTSDDGAEGRIVVAADGAEAIALAARANPSPFSFACPMRFPGLEPHARYEVRLLDPWPRRAAARLPEADLWGAPRMFDGAGLGIVGLRLPLSDPETAWLLHFIRS